MKKLLAVSLAGIMMVSLAGCSDASAKITTGEDVLFTVGDKKITNEDIYRPLVLSNGYNTVSEMVNNAIFDKEVPITDEITTAAKASLEDSKKDMGDSFANKIKEYGFKNEEDFYNRVSMPSVRLEELTKKFLSDNAEAQIKTYKPVKARIIACTSEENAKKALEAVKGDTSFEDAATEFGKTDTYKGNEIVVNQSSGLPSAVWSKISVVADKELLISDIITDSTTDAANPVYYVVKVTNTAALDEFKDEALKSILDKSSTVKADAMKEYLKKYEFHVYDIDIYNGFKAKNADYLVQDAD